MLSAISVVTQGHFLVCVCIHSVSLAPLDCKFRSRMDPALLGEPWLLPGWAQVAPGNKYCMNPWIKSWLLPEVWASSEKAQLVFL